MLPEDLSRQHFLPVLRKCLYCFSGQKNTMKYVRKKGRMHDHIQRTLAAKAAEMVRRKQYFLPKVGRSRYACNTGSAFCQQEYSIKCTYGNTECWISSYLPLLVVFRSIISHCHQKSSTDLVTWCKKTKKLVATESAPAN